jgi:hypothetical protein
MSRHTLGLDTENPHLAVLDVEGMPIERPWQFVHPIGKQVSPVARAFMEMVRTDARALVLDPLGHDAGSAA